MADIIVLGDQPGPNTDAKDALYPHTTTGAAARLAELMGLDTEKYIRVTRRMNINHDGENLLAPEHASTRMKGILAGTAPGKLIIVVGKAAANRHPDTKDLGFGDVIDYQGSRLVIIPHTSGRNRYWNDKGNKTRIALILREELQKIGERNLAKNSG
jgi:hypothetical protein